MKPESTPSLLLQAAAYGAFLLVIGVFSNAPRYAFMSPDLALLRVNISHAGERAQPCRRYTSEEIAAMAPNMRRPMDCIRERVALRLRLDVDGETVMDETLAPTGLSGDGPSSVYARFPLPPGQHTVIARLRDSRRPEGFDYEQSFQLELAAGESRVLGFRPNRGGFGLL